ncbi:MAG: hypothetical protein AAF289_01995 [Cyanobacteria bacterium P01_A01_bin.135]
MSLNSTAMHRAILLFLVATVLWIFGSLPWVVINSLLCDRGFTGACPDPKAVSTAVRQILALDLILMIMAAFAVIQLRHRSPAAPGRRPRQRPRSKGPGSEG